MRIWLEGFLEVDDRLKLTIMEILYKRRNDHATVGAITDSIGVSKFKLTKAIQDINEDLIKLDREVNIQGFFEGDLNDVSVSLEIVKLLRTLYIQRSKTYLMFNAMLYGAITLGQFSQKNYISRSKAFEIRNNLMKLLKGSSIVIEDGAFRGDEEELRKIAFDIYYYYFNGSKISLPSQVDNLKFEILGKVEEEFQLDLTLTKKIKLDIFLSVSSIRILGGNHLCGRKLVFFDKNYKSERIFNQLILSTSRENLMVESINELDFLYLFLFCEDCIVDKKEKGFSAKNHEIENISKVLVNKFFSLVNLNNWVTAEITEELKKNLEVTILKINFKRYYCFHNAITLSNNREISYFEKSYPQFHKIILSFFEDNHSQKLVKINNLEKIDLYYDYMFAFLSVIPLRYLNDNIFICIDFSRGDEYTEYIDRCIQAFRYLNIIIQRKLNHSTQLFLSDFFIDNKQVKQVIWEDPPSADDWAELVDAIISIRGSAI